MMDGPASPRASWLFKRNTLARRKIHSRSSVADCVFRGVGSDGMSLPSGNVIAGQAARTARPARSARPAIAQSSHYVDRTKKRAT